MHIQVVCAFIDTKNQMQKSFRDLILPCLVISLFLHVAVNTSCGNTVGTCC